MKTTGLILTAAVIGFAGAASAECSWGSYTATTADAKVDMTPIPTAEAEVADPALLLLDADTTQEG